MTKSRQTSPAFTLIELLVVISIIGVLISILLPSLGSARAEAVKVQALAANRSLMGAFVAYAGDHKDRVIPGYLPPFVDGRLVEAQDEFGTTIGPPASQRWVYRLGPWFDFAWGGTTHVGAQGEMIRRRSQIVNSAGEADWSYRVSVYPSFGLNMRFVGGNEAAPADIARGMHIRRMDEPMRPTELIVFASARFYGDGGEVVQGFHRVEIPGVGAAFNESGPPAAFGAVHPRYKGRAAIGWFDGHAGTLGVEELTDARRWADPAARADDADWRP